jgi:hypothetical protein
MLPGSRDDYSYMLEPIAEQAAACIRWRMARAASGSARLQGPLAADRHAGPVEPHLARRPRDLQ